MDELLGWWDANAAAGRASVLFCYAWARRSGARRTRPAHDRPVFVHGAIDALLDAYRDEGIRFALVPVGARRKGELCRRTDHRAASAFGSPWLRRFGDASTGFASGWMRVRRNRRRRGFDRGFVLSDHVDWPALLRTIEQTGAKRVLATHGYSDSLARYLREIGLAAEPLETLFGDEVEEAAS